jgi:hypothetical protein
MSPYFYLRLIYYVFISFLAVAILIAQVKIYQHARQNRLTRVLTWAIPGLINGVIAAIVLGIDDLYLLMNLRETKTAYVLTLALGATSMTFCLVSVQRLWEMVQATPPASSAPENDPQESGVWPPAPKSAQ